MSMDQSGTRGRDSSLYSQLQIHLGEAKTVLPAGALARELGYNPGAVELRPSCPGCLARGHLTALLFHSHGFPQLSCITVELFSFLVQQ